MTTVNKYLVFLIMLGMSSCTDQWLSIKPDKKLVVPTTADELQALLDNTNRMNNSVMSNLLEISTDNVFLTTQQWVSKGNVEERNAYIWAKDIYEGGSVLSWINHYGQVYYSNIVLEGLDRLSPSNEKERDQIINIKGSALFFRSWAFYNLSQLFCKPYNPESAANEPGIPLRLSSDMVQPTTRATIKDVYARVIEDVTAALSKLPEKAIVPTRPSKVAAFALLAKVYLLMGDYDSALSCVDSALGIQHELMDYRQFDSSLRYPFQIFNKETIFYQTMAPTTFFIDTNLMAEYTENDLRRKLFFQEQGDQFVFKGSYSNSRLFFSGIAVDELLLLRAECRARVGNPQANLDLRKFVSHRYHNPSDELERIKDIDLLDAILLERRKQLVYRGLRWQDLRRLNTDPTTAVTLERNVNGENYQLIPNDSRYIFALPDDVIENNPGIEQNYR